MIAHKTFLPDSYTECKYGGPLASARDKSNESEASWALMFCFDDALTRKSCFVVDLVLLFRPYYAFLCSRMPPQQSGIFHSRESVPFFSSRLPLRGNQRDGGKEFTFAEGTV